MFGQTGSEKEIPCVAKEISGKWILVKYERDSLIRKWSFDQGKYLVKTFNKKDLTETNELNGYNVRLFQFDSTGLGLIEYYFDYKTESNENIDYGIDEENEVHELIEDNGEIVIKTTYLYGEDDFSWIEILNQHKLVLSNRIGTRWTYKRIK